MRKRALRRKTHSPLNNERRVTRCLRLCSRLALALPAAPAILRRHCLLLSSAAASGPHGGPRTVRAETAHPETRHDTKNRHRGERPEKHRLFCGLSETIGGLSET